MTTLTAEQMQKIDELYNYHLPKYLVIKGRNRIEIKASVWEGAPVKKLIITPEDVVHYYRQDNPLGCASMSGVRRISGFTTDWRMVDNIAKEALEIFKITDPEALRKEGAKFGMELKE